jgi:hypothetical protein
VSWTRIVDINRFHAVLSCGSIVAYRRFAKCLASNTHVIIESMLDEVPSDLRLEELDLAEEALGTTQTARVQNKRANPLLRQRKR